MLVEKYIPNLIAKPFDVSYEYTQVVYNQTSSPKLDKVFKKWEEDILTCPGIGFIKMLYSCTTSMTSFSVGLLPSIEKSLRVALSCLTRLIRPNPNMLQFPIYPSWLFFFSFSSVFIVLIVHDCYFLP